MPFISRPKELTLPDEPFYPVERLFLFDRHNRLTWSRRSGAGAGVGQTAADQALADTTALEGWTIRQPAG